MIIVLHAIVFSWNSTGSQNHTLRPPVVLPPVAETGCPASFSAQLASHTWSSASSFVRKVSSQTIGREVFGSRRDRGSQLGLASTPSFGTPYLPVFGLMRTTVSSQLGTAIDR
jgi:hypothetical protein